MEAFHLLRTLFQQISECLFDNFLKSFSLRNIIFVSFTTINVYELNMLIFELNIMKYE